jgi:hypothetical protein
VSKPRFSANPRFDTLRATASSREMVYEANGIRADWAEDVATDLAWFDGRVARLGTFTFEDGVGCHTYSPHCARALPVPRRSTTSSSPRSDRRISRRCATKRSYDEPVSVFAANWPFPRVRNEGPPGSIATPTPVAVNQARPLWSPRRVKEKSERSC